MYFYVCSCHLTDVDLIQILHRVRHVSFLFLFALCIILRVPDMPISLCPILKINSFILHFKFYPQIQHHLPAVINGFPQYIDHSCNSRFYQKLSINSIVLSYNKKTSIQKHHSSINSLISTCIILTYKQFDAPSQSVNHRFRDPSINIINTLFYHKYNSVIICL